MIVEWKGYITSINKKTFIANVYDISREDYTYEEAEIPIKYLEDMVVGSCFDMIIDSDVEELKIKTNNNIKIYTL